MKNLFFLFLASSIFMLSACNGQQTNDQDSPEDKGVLESQVRALEEEMMNNRTKAVFDTATATNYINKSRKYVGLYPKDTLSPMLLFRSGEVARGLGEFHMSIKFWDQMTKSYPDHRKAPEALFLQGFTYDNHLNQLEEAASHYEAFLERYPKHPIAGDVQMLLEAAKSGKSPDEMIKEFEKNREEE
jgi:tetratricopeptide (TPR) repeat protein